MAFRRLSSTWAALLTAVGGCTCGSDDIGNISQNLVVIESPTGGDTLFTKSSATFRAVATNPNGLQFLALQVGTSELKRCDAGEDPTSITCEATFNLTAYGSQISEQSELTLTAQAKDANDVTTSSAVRIFVKSIVIKFRRPVIPTGRDRAPLRGTDLVEVTVETATPVEAVEVRLDEELVRQARGDRPSYAWNDVVWAALPTGTGDHVLKASARDTNGQSDTATLDVRVACTKDTECAAGSRCCAEDGACHAVVERGAECDCAHPCPADQGCFPGICGQTPRRCRPGCDPGSDTRYAARCAPQDGQTAYCLRLPAAEATAQNRGGACALGDGCGVVAQDCPPLPLDRTQAAGPDNPAAPHTCVPVSPVATACLPAGNIPLNGTDCAYDTCGDPTKACAKGLLCVTPVNASGAPSGPSRCVKQCAQPFFSNGTNFPTQARDCPTGEFCGGLLGVGGERMGTGSCTEL
jgi:hypothetical protein